MEKEKIESLKKEYESPVIVFVEFELNDSIASSADNGSTTICSEGLWG